MRFILNPQAGGGRIMARWGAIARLMEDSGVPIDLARTRYPGQATKLAREALLSGVETIVAVGGDGTLHEVVNGFFSEGRAIRPGARLGLIPGGSGSDWARTAGIPSEPAAAIAVLLRGEARPVDVGRVTFRDRRGDRQERHFLNSASVGLSARVAENFGHLPGWLRSPAGYAATGVAGLLRHRGSALSLRVDGERHELDRAGLVVVGNGRYFGGGMEILPSARPDDGRLDLLVAEDRSRLDRVRAMAGVYGGHHTSLPFVTERRVQVVEIEADPAAPLELDGEVPGVTPVRIEVLPAALSFLTWGWRTRR
jgi:YegS/Rv2252/BmrU family lipid kinase